MSTIKFINQISDDLFYFVFKVVAKGGVFCTFKFELKLLLFKPSNFISFFIRSSFFSYNLFLSKVNGNKYTMIHLYNSVNNLLKTTKRICETIWIFLFYLDYYKYKYKFNAVDFLQDLKFMFLSKNRNWFILIYRSIHIDSYGIKNKYLTIRLAIFIRNFLSFLYPLIGIDVVNLTHEKIVKIWFISNLKKNIIIYASQKTSR